MFKKKGFVFLLAIFSFFILSKRVFAQGEFNCPNRYLVLVNPVRGRTLWLDQSLKPLEDQHQALAKYHFAGTWLFQYGALNDREIISFVQKNFSENQEAGLFLEVSPDFALAARVIYPSLVAWYEPKAVFLSGYSQSERRRLIDTAFNKFKEIFGSYPLSVGSWWIDSYSLNYMKKKYGIKAVLIVANQLKTDNYSIWGHWWGIPYYPSRANILVPASNEKTKLDVVVLQWAQRDLTEAYGEGPVFSNYSIQANDYLERGLKTAYFKNLINYYLDCQLPIAQITVGLETGIESVKVFPEFLRQIDVLSKIKNLQSLTMSEFSERYRSFYFLNPEKVVLRDDKSEWILTPLQRKNKNLKEKIVYKDDIAFKDFFIADKSNFLERILPIDAEKVFVFRPLILAAFLLGLIFYFRAGLIKEYWLVSLFILSSFLTTFLTYSKYGRVIYFGPILKNISLIQFLLVLFSFLFFLFFLKFFSSKIKNLYLLMISLSLSYAADFCLSILRYTKLENEHFLGFAWDSLRFIGLKVSPKSLKLVNQDFSPLISGALLKFDFNQIWENKFISLIIYPLAHFFTGILIYFILGKLPRKIQKIFLIFLFLGFCLFFYCTQLTKDNPLLNSRRFYQ